MCMYLCRCMYVCMYVCICVFTHNICSYKAKADWQSTCFTKPRSAGSTPALKAHGAVMARR